MPPTSSPFRIPPRPNPSRSRASPQFASTPRFLLLQDTPRPAKEDDIDVDESPESTPLATLWTGSGTRQAQHEVIEDSDDSLSQEIGRSRQYGDNIVDRDTGSSPPDPPSTLDSEFELLFGSVKDRSKRRRISLDPDTPATQQRTHPDPILSSSPPENTLSPPNAMPAPGRRYIEPTPSKPPPSNYTSGPSTPGATKTPFRNQPRFKLSSTQQPFPSSQPQFNLATPFPAQDSSAQKRKPAFILPRSPSPSREAEEDLSIPTPFSPSSHTLRRRGRGRGGPPGYLPGGMAAEVRSWILEMGTKREQLIPTPNPNYLLMVRVENVRQGGLGTSGPVAFVVGSCVGLSGEQDAKDEDSRNILLFGVPRSRPEGLSAEGVPELKAGNLIGVHRGLVWEIELDKVDSQEPGSTDDSSAEMEKWLVCMEWDLIE